MFGPALDEGTAVGMFEELRDHRAEQLRLGGQLVAFDRNVDPVLRNGANAR